MCHGKRIGVGYYLNRGKCINNHINMLYMILDSTYNGTYLRLPLINIVTLQNFPHFEALHMWPL